MTKEEWLEKTLKFHPKVIDQLFHKKSLGVIGIKTEYLTKIYQEREQAIKKAELRARREAFAESLSELKMRPFRFYENINLEIENVEKQLKEMESNDK